MTRQTARALAAKLDIDLFRDGVCLACLTLVAFPLRDGDGPQVTGAITQVLPMLWAEGLDRVALRLVTEARDAGAPHAATALEELEELGWRSPIARAIVRRLAEAMVIDMTAAWN